MSAWFPIETNCAKPAQNIENPAPEGARLAYEPDVTAFGEAFRKASVKTNGGMGVDDAEAVGSDETHAVAADLLGKFRFKRGSFVSLKPAEITTRPRMPFAWQSSTTDNTALELTTTIARSTPSGRSATRSKTRNPSIVPPLGFTG